MSKDDLIRRGAAIGALEDRQNRYRKETVSWAQIEMDILALKAVPASPALQEARDKIATLEAEIELITLKWKRAHEVVENALPFWSRNEGPDAREYLGNVIDTYYNAPY